MPLSSCVFLGLGWPWVGEFVGFIIAFICFPKASPIIQWCRRPVRKSHTSGRDHTYHDLDNLVPHLPLWEVVQDPVQYWSNARDMSQIMQVIWLHKMLCRTPFSTDPTHETWPRWCKWCGSTPRQHELDHTDHTDQGSIWAERSRSSSWQIFPTRVTGEGCTTFRNTWSWMP